MLGSAEALRNSFNIPMDSLDKNEYEALVARFRSAMSSDEFEAARDLWRKHGLAGNLGYEYRRNFTYVAANAVFDWRGFVSLAQRQQ